ncbi:hypothetical protein [Streptomyces sp. NBC_01264]|uniref:hypothetical protein n=1 Tax=Streptomyces sp. NBC_01264 TaxID=2903804 RepID=UPI0022505861|nr:hypothetical protein [Streptomyces sp. NBC_01264]MCX4778701.1 hypothetical protein [Streptomyces sp. NBC_01264]
MSRKALKFDASLIPESLQSAPTAVYPIQFNFGTSPISQGFIAPIFRARTCSNINLRDLSHIEINDHIPQCADNLKQHIHEHLRIAQSPSEIVCQSESLFEIQL